MEGIRDLMTNIFCKDKEPCGQTNDNACQLITTPSHTIQNIYPNPPITYDGVDAKEVRCIYGRDLASGLEKILFSQCGKEVENDDKNDCECEMKMTGKDLKDLEAATMADTSPMNMSKSFFKKVSEKFQNSSKHELDRIEQMASDLYNHSDQKEGTKWCNLNNYEKLPFYWIASDTQFVVESPFENFKRFYKMEHFTDQPCPITEKQMNEKFYLTWHGMTMKERLPFVMESFIFCLYNGEINWKDEQEIKCLMNKLKNNSKDEIISSP